MIPQNILLEKIKNPLRKQYLKDIGANIDNRTLQSLTSKEWKDYILHGVDLDEHDKKIKSDYLKLKKHFPSRAELWLDQLSFKYGVNHLRTKIKYEKIYEKNGVQVFIDEFVTESFKPQTYNYKILKFSIDAMLWDIRDLLPNRRPRIIITNKNLNGLFRDGVVKDAPALYSDRIIYIDQYAIDTPQYFVHEYAHFVVDLIPRQTEMMLDKAYKTMLDFYWKRAKVRRQQLEPNTDDEETNSKIDAWRKKISKKLGFPEYGLMNRDEFFAVLIENWKKFPNNAITYRYKNLVKGILSRL